MMRVVLGGKNLFEKKKKKGTKRERKWFLFYIHTQCRERDSVAVIIKNTAVFFFHVVVRKRFYRRRLLFVPPRSRLLCRHT